MSTKLKAKVFLAAIAHIFIAACWRRRKRRILAVVVLSAANTVGWPGPDGILSGADTTRIAGVSSSSSHYATLEKCGEIVLWALWVPRPKKFGFKCLWSMKASVDHVGSNSTYISVHRSSKELTEQIYLCYMVFGENICHTHHYGERKFHQVCKTFSHWLINYINTKAKCRHLQKIDL